MKYNNELLKEYALTGKDANVPTVLLWGCLIMILFHGYMLYGSTYSLKFTVCFTLPFLLIYLFVSLYAKNKSKNITNGYNFLVLSVSGFTLSITELVVSISLNYNETNSRENIFISLFIFIITTILFYLFVFYKISKFKRKQKNENLNTKIGIGPPIGAFVLPIVLVARELMQNMNQYKLALFFSVGTYFMAILYMFLTSFIIKFIYLKKNNLIE